jgi:hypothetical protein
LEGKSQDSLPNCCNLIEPHVAFRIRGMESELHNSGGELRAR